MLCFYTRPHWELHTGIHLFHFYNFYALNFPAIKSYATFQSSENNIYNESLLNSTQLSYMYALPGKCACFPCTLGVVVEVPRCGGSHHAYQPIGTAITGKKVANEQELKSPRNTCLKLFKFHSFHIYIPKIFRTNTFLVDKFYQCFNNKKLATQKMPVRALHAPIGLDHLSENDQTEPDVK